MVVGLHGVRSSGKHARTRWAGPEGAIRDLCGQRGVTLSGAPQQVYVFLMKNCTSVLREGIMIRMIHVLV